MGNHSTKHQSSSKARPKKNVHWKSAGNLIFDFSYTICLVNFLSKKCKQTEQNDKSEKCVSETENI